MKQILTFVVVLAASICFSACNKSPVETAPQAGSAGEQNAVTAAADSRPSNPALQAVPSPNTAPDKIVTDFLQALRDGNDSLAEALLTTTAREETAKRSLAVQPPGTPSATFQIGEVDYVTSDQKGAHVRSVWTESDDQGNSVSYEIVWALRRQQEGWRIAGMATRVSEAASPIFLNFEDPDDMLRKWKDAEATLAAEQNTTVHQASRGNAGGTTTVPR